MSSKKPADSGASTPAVLMATGFAMILFVALANLVVFQYAAGVVRSALDTGARSASLLDAPLNACEIEIAEVLDGLLGGAMGDGVAYSCALDPTGQTVVAAATVTLPGFAPMVPDWSFDAQATAIKEQAP
ncbi:MAG: hypothetical protein OES24_21770 [Acidimicrobiia bacterium]|nr:hypothetical protein [Acidimicrobiia bacterium]